MSLTSGRPATDDDLRETLAALYPRMDFSHDTRASMIARLSAARVQLQGSSMAEIGEPVQTDTLLHVLALAQRRHSGVR